MSPEQVFSVMHEEAKRGWWDDSLICEFQSMINEDAVNRNP
jgi:hypothetical protein